MFLIFAVAYGNGFAQAKQQSQNQSQQPPSPEQQQPEYTAEEYEAYQRAINEPDLAKREDAMVAFMKANSQSALNQYALGSYLELMQRYQKENKAQNVVTAGEKLLALQPNDLNALYMTTLAYYQLQQYAKVVNHGETVYAKNPTAGLAFILANSYGMLKNDEKYVLYGEKACAEMPPKDTFQILSGLMRIYAAKEQWNKAAEYAKKTLEAFDAAQKPAPISDAEWKDYAGRQKAVGYAVLGRQAAERGNWPGAISNYQAALRLYSNPALNAEAYYYIGVGSWKQNRIDPAMEAFAKGFVQKAPHSKPCKQYLETLYKGGHNDSLAGLEEFIERVTGR